MSAASDTPEGIRSSSAGSSIVPHFIEGDPPWGLDLGGKDPKQDVGRLVVFLRLSLGVIDGCRHLLVLDLIDQGTSFDTGHLHRLDVDLIAPEILDDVRPEIE